MGLDAGTLSVFSQGTSAVGGLLKGIGTSSADKFNAAVAAQNSQLADQYKTWSMAAGEAQYGEEGMRTRAKVGAIKAGQAASNIDVNTGSARDVQASESALGALSGLTIRSNAARQAYGYEVKSQQDLTEAELYKKEAGQAQLQGAMTFLGGAAKTGAEWIKLRNAGGLGTPDPYAGAPSAALDVGSQPTYGAQPAY